MYNEVKTSTSIHSECKEIAEKMAQEIFERFTPDEQNIALRAIFQGVLDKRGLQIEAGQNQVDQLKKLTEELRASMK